MNAKAAALALLLGFVTAAGATAQSTASPLMRPVGVATDGTGDIFVADAARNQVIELATGGLVSVVAGNGTQGSSGDGGPATAAELNAPTSVVVGTDGTLYIADSGNDRVRAVQAGTIATFAGNGRRAFSGDGGPATAAALNRPVAVAIDSGGGLLISDQGNQRVRRIGHGVITTVAGNGVQGFAGDAGAATAAELNEPSGVVAGADGSIFIADTANQRVRVVEANGIISTFAGTGNPGSAGDGGPATSAQLNRPVALALDAAGEIFVTDENNHRLRRIAMNGTISTIAGTGRQGAAPDGAIAISSAQNLPAGAAVSAFGWPIIADAASGTVQILFTDGKLYAPAGLSSRATSVTLTAPAAVYGAASGTITVSASPGTAQGRVQVADGGTAIGTATLAQGGAMIALGTLGAGPHTLTASYLGDGLHASETGTATVQIAPAPVSVTASPATVSYGAAIPSLTGTVAGVLPQDEGNVSVAFTASALATPPVGSYPISASLAGPASTNYTVSLAPGSGTLTVVPAATVATVTPPAAAYATLPLQLTARIGSTTSGTPSGTVEFLDGNTVVGTAPLVNGSASAIELNPAGGEHSFSVTYSGDSNFHASTSAPLLEAVSALPDFTVALAGTAQQTVVAGATANYTLTIASQNSPFTGVVTLSASGLPTGSSVSFSPPAVVPGASAAAVTMTVATRDAIASVTGSSAGKRRKTGAEPVLAFVLGGGLLLLAAPRRRMPSRLLVILAAAGIFGLAGCGARTASEAVLPVQSFTIHVQATGTNLAGNVVEHTVNVTLAIQ